MSGRDVGAVYDLVEKIKDEDLKQLRDNFHTLDKKLVEQNHIKEKVGVIEGRVIKIDKRCKANLYDADGIYAKLEDRIDQHDAHVLKAAGKKTGMVAVESAMLKWLPVIIMIVALILNYLANGGGA